MEPAGLVKCVCARCQDFHSQLYESYYLNFISAISRQKLEDIALAAIQTNVVTQVSKVPVFC